MITGTGTAQTGGAAAVVEPATLTKEKESIHNQFNRMREVCEKSNNWTEINPLLNKLIGGFDNFFKGLHV